MINSIQYLRGIAALIVVLHHATGALLVHFSLSQKDFFAWGAGGVDLFFVISGFIMVHITYNKSVNVKRFLLKRIIRIYPIFWVYASIALLIFLINPDMINRSAVHPTLILPSYLLFPYTEFTNLVQVAWTLIYELHFYLIFTLSLFLTDKYRYICAALILSIIAMSSLIGFKSYYFSYVTNPIILEFLLGMIVYFIVFKKYNFELLTLTLLFSISAIILFFNNFLPERVLFYGIPSFLLMTIVLSLDLKGLLGKGNSKISKILGKLGDSSYSLYLSHNFCIGVGVIVFNKLNIINNYTAQILIFILAIGACIWGYISYKYIESPLINKLNSFIK